MVKGNLRWVVGNDFEVPWRRLCRCGSEILIARSTEDRGTSLPLEDIGRVGIVSS